MDVITISDLHYTIEKKEILNGIDFSIQENEKVALLGSNGSGKSTIIDIIADNFSPTSGEVKVYNNTFKKRKKDIGVLYDNSPFFPALKVKELISFATDIHEIKEENSIVNQLKESLGIEKINNSLFYALSKGERKKVGIILSLIHSPSLFIADEPTSFLDPSMRSKYWKILFNRKDLTVLFTTHIWEEAEQYADKVVFISEGRQLLKIDTVANYLSDKYIVGTKKIVVDATNAIKDKLPNATVVTYDEQHHIFSEDFKGTLGIVQQSINKYSLLEKGLEDIYHYLISKNN
jgi:ABC-type multidrug transport system ATPase subunit